MESDLIGDRKEKRSALPDEYRQGFAMFCGCKIDLSQRVLIPRPETEFMVRCAIRDSALSDCRHPAVLDIFSGSGCIGVAIARNIPNARVDFSDIDPRARRQIEINLGINNIGSGQYRIFNSDIFKSIPQDARYDIILANPPYIDPTRINEIQKSVIEYEPHHALFGGRKGLEIIERFLCDAGKFLNPSGLIYMEFDPQQAAAVERILDDGNYRRYDFNKDQFGQTRFLKITA